MEKETERDTQGKEGEGSGPYTEQTEGEGNMKTG